MKNRFLYTTIMFFAVMLVLQSCNKTTDYLEHLQQTAAKNYRVKSISFPLSWEGFDYRSYNFSYNEKGDPSQIVFTDDDSYGFNYDAQGRLSVFYLYFGGKEGFTAFAHYYGNLDASSLIDSFYYGSRYPTEPTEYRYHVISLVKLDEKGRVIWEKVTEQENSTFKVGQVTTYTYDADGNLVSPGAKYTKKPSIRSLSKVYQLIDRNYSTYATENEGEDYNTAGLPQRLKKGGKDFLSLGYSDTGKIDGLPGPDVEYEQVP